MTLCCFRILIGLSCLLLLASCGADGNKLPDAAEQVDPNPQTVLTGMQWPDTLPLDATQPWEREAMAEVNGVPVIAYIDKGRNVISYGIWVE